MKSPWARASICRRGMVGIEVPVEGAQAASASRKLGILDEAFDAALASQAGLIGEQAMEELQVRAAGVLGLLQARRRVARRSPGHASVAKSARIWSRRLGVAVVLVRVVVAFFLRTAVSSAGSSGESKC